MDMSKHMVLLLPVIFVSINLAVSFDQDEVIFITGGYASSTGGYTSSRSVEVLDPTGASTCKPPVQLTTPRNSHTMNFINSSLIICGGYERSVWTSCIRADHTSVEWEEHSTTTTPRRWHSSGVAGGELLLLGGWDVLDAAQSVESFTGGRWVERSRSPYTIGWGSCSAQEGEESVLVTGGYFGGFSKKVGRWNVMNGWDVSLPEMSVGRVHHGCGIVTGPGGKQYLVVAGGPPGVDSNSNLPGVATSEIFDIEANAAWVAMGNLNQVRRGGQMVIVKVEGVDRILMLGGRDENTVEELSIDFNDLGNSRWTSLEVTMNMPRYVFAAVAVPKEDYC